MRMDLRLGDNRKPAGESVGIRLSSTVGYGIHIAHEYTDGADAHGVAEMTLKPFNLGEVRGKLE